MKVVTAGAAYMDIDAYASCIAYAALFKARGEQAIAASSAPLNSSVPALVRSWGGALETNYRPKPDDEFIIVDVSNPAAFDTLAPKDRIVEVIDHHPGFIGYWQDRPEVDADIEFIGAACTMIYERWKAAGLLDKLGTVNARLLVCGILDNTLNFKAVITTARDHAAYEDLLKRADLPADWPKKYFDECQKVIEADLVSAIKNDLKDFTEVPELPDYMGQLVVWNADRLVRSRSSEIMDILGAISPDWGVNIVSISEGRSYFMARNPRAQAKLNALLGVTFKDDIARADRLWLRKEILKLVHTEAAR
jgi:inorganic pyrophosphatase/exopolyphosphatase